MLGLIFMQIVKFVGCFISSHKDQRCVSTIEKSGEFYLLDQFAQLLFDKFASSKVAELAFLLKFGA
jgi:hypothetical protein